MESATRSISPSDFKEILKGRKPSVSIDMMKAYAHWSEQFKALQTDYVDRLQTFLARLCSLESSRKNTQSYLGTHWRIQIQLHGFVLLIFNIEEKNYAILSLVNCKSQFMMNNWLRLRIVPERIWGKINLPNDTTLYLCYYLHS